MSNSEAGRKNMSTKEAGGHTDRLLIRIMERRDLEFARLLHNADDTLFCLSDIEQISEPQQERWFERLSVSAHSRRYTVTETATNDYVGIFRVDELDWKNRSVRIGLDITSKKRGRHFSYDIYFYFLDYFFNQCGLHRVYLATLKMNKRAQGLYEKIGFTIEGQSRDALFRDGHFQDRIWYSLLADEYKK